MSFTNEIEYYIYEEYIELGNEAYLDKIRYFESNQKLILSLPFDRSIEIQCDYIEALHQTNNYNMVLNIVDPIIASIISENVYEIKGSDVYKSLLYIKSDCLYNTINYKAANHVISELIKIEGENKTCKTLFINNSVDNFRYEGQKIRAISILMFLSSALIIALEILVIRSFYTEWINIFVAIRNILFLSGLITIFGQEIIIRIKSFKSYTQLLK